MGTHLAQPTTIGVYNRFMGGVDLAGRTQTQCMPVIRSKRPTRSLFIRLLLMTAANARILYALCRGWAYNKVLVSPTEITDNNDYCRCQ
jgi:hypothetical protein